MAKRKPLVQVDASTLRRIAVAADVDPRTVQKEIRDPGIVRGSAGHRLRDVLVEHGLSVTSSNPMGR